VGHETGQSLSASEEEQLKTALALLIAHLLQCLAAEEDKAGTQTGTCSPKPLQKRPASGNDGQAPESTGDSPASKPLPRAPP